MQFSSILSLVLWYRFLSLHMLHWSSHLFQAIFKQHCARLWYAELKAHSQTVSWTTEAVIQFVVTFWFLNVSTIIEDKVCDQKLITHISILKNHSQINHWDINHVHATSVDDHQGHLCLQSPLTIATALYCYRIIICLWLFGAVQLDVNPNYLKTKHHSVQHKLVPLFLYRKAHWSSTNHHHIRWDWTFFNQRTDFWHWKQQNNW